MRVSGERLFPGQLQVTPKNYALVWSEIYSVAPDYISLDKL